MRLQFTTGLALSSVFFTAVAARSQTISAEQSNPSGIYAPGAEVTWTIQASGNGVATLTAVPYAIKSNQLTVVKDGVVDLSRGPIRLKASLDQPGTIGVSMKLPSADKPKLVAGAIVSPDKIDPSTSPPDDFEQFWKQKVAAVEAVALNAQVDKGKSSDRGVEYYKVRLDNINGTHVYGQLAKPAGDGKFPALLVFQSAGVRPLPTSQVLPHAANGYLAFNIMAHDLPIDERAEFYRKAQEATGPSYFTIGSEDREKSYFLRMYLGCYQAARYLTTRDDWDGKTLIVMGASQGGMQALATAGLHPGVTAVIANVPAGCDATGVLSGRATGFPYWRGWNREPNRKAMEVGRYYDGVNFAPKIKVPTLMSLGLLDETCPAVGVMSAFNQLQGPKERIIMPISDHHGTGDSQREYVDQSNLWLNSLKNGRATPQPKQQQ